MNLVSLLFNYLSRNHFSLYSVFILKNSHYSFQSFQVPKFLFFSNFQLTFSSTKTILHQSTTKTTISSNEQTWLRSRLISSSRVWIRDWKPDFCFTNSSCMLRSSWCKKRHRNHSHYEKFNSTDILRAKLISWSPSGSSPPPLPQQNLWGFYETGFCYAMICSHNSTMASKHWAEPQDGLPIQRWVTHHSTNPAQRRVTQWMCSTMG